MSTTKQLTKTKNGYTGVDLTPFQVNYTNAVTAFPAIKREMPGRGDIWFTVIDGDFCLTRNQICSLMDITVQGTSQHIMNIYGEIFCVLSTVKESLTVGMESIPAITIEGVMCYGYADLLKHYRLRNLPIDCGVRSLLTIINNRTV